MILSVIILTRLLILQDCKYILNTDLTTQSSNSVWNNVVDNTQVNTCQGSSLQYYVGISQSSSLIAWQNSIVLQKSSKIYVYLEFQASGTWMDDEISIFANKVKVYSQKINLADTTKDCNERFNYENFAFFVLSSMLDSLLLEIKVNNQNLGLFVNNLVILQQVQRGRNEVLSFTSSKVCPTEGQKFTQYYCQCDSNKVLQGNQCVQVCAPNYIYNSQDNTCYPKQYCSSCTGLNQSLLCDSGYYLLEGSDVLASFCVARCPNSYYQDETLKKCTSYQDYLSQNFNGNNPVNQFYFYKSLIEFFIYYNYNDIKIVVVSEPQKVNERGFFFWNNAYYVGSFSTFQKQSVLLTLNTKSSQHKIKFRAIGHFIDFIPTKNDVYINGVKQQNIDVQIDSINQLNQDQLDYIVYYEFWWQRIESVPVLQNTVLFQIEQTTQYGQYIGRFYLDDIQLYSLQCQSNCDNCYQYQSCSPCSNPQNKNYIDCTCLSGYVMVNDVCIGCPTYCATCLQAGVCAGCKATTLRINSPQCNACPINYYVDPTQDNCQHCQIGCNICSNNLSCTNCLSGFYRNSLNQCITQCPDGQFNDNTMVSDPKCSVCDINCLNCEIESTRCTDCKGKAKLINNKCYICNEGYFLDGIVCTQCINNCQKCNSITCSLCQDSYYYTSDSNQCQGICDDGYYGDVTIRSCIACHPLCQTCSAGTQKDCLTCSQGRVLNVQNMISGECLTNCLIGYYKVNEQCVKCWKGCSSCIDATQQCLSCAQGYYRMKSDGFCYDLCPNGYYNNNIGNYCSQCNQLCKTCNGFTENDCLSCNKPLALYKTQCLSECPDQYGNINDICVACPANCKSCFGTAPDQCLTCNVGYYYLRNQCFFKCPTFFVGIRPQYICKCIFDDCVTCQSNQFFLNNRCYVKCPQGYYGYNGLCIKCDLTCYACFGESFDQCVTCQTGLVLYQNTCIKTCLGNTYKDITDNSCKQCDSSCLACFGPNPNQCNVCNDAKLLTKQNQCSDYCPDNQYAVLSEKKCYECHSSCKTCFGPSNINCLSCTNYFYLYQCVDSCPDGFHISSNGLICQPNFDIVISQCSYQCDTCELTVRFCKKCASNRASNPPNCNCESGYFDDGQSPQCPQCSNKCLNCVGNANNCITCKGDRQLPNCDCPQYYYDDGEQVYCLKCQDNCLTCDKQGCTQCLGNRIKAPQCVCEDGYFEAFTQYCQECSKQCHTCFGTALLCTSCSGIRENAPICNCPKGYFENSDQDCQQCESNCMDCNQYGCVSCFGNRVGPINGECKCDDFGISRYTIGSSYCTDCQYGIPFFGLNENLTGFTIDFGGQTFFIQSETLGQCATIFSPKTLAKLGSNPVCDDGFTIYFGDNASLKVGDTIQLNNVYQLFGCNFQYQIILENTLQIPSRIDKTQVKPQIIFKEFQQQNICFDTIIQPVKYIFNGNQKLKIIQWKQIIPQQISSNVQQILDYAVLNNNDTILFPAQLLDSGVYSFSVTVESFAKIQNTITIKFEAALKSTIQFSNLIDLNQFHRFENISIPSKIFYYNCKETNTAKQKLTYQILLQENKQQIMRGELTENLTNGFTQDIDVQFNSYFFNFQNPHVLIYNAILQRPDYTVTIQKSFNLYIIPSHPIITILGGNRMVGYTENLYLNSTIIDQDYTQTEAQQMNYTCIWQCLDIMNRTSCLNHNQEELKFSSDCNQSIKAKALAPYQVFTFELSIQKVDQIYSTNVSIQIIELDLPQLSVHGTNQLNTHNFYDELIYKLDYPNINPDLLMYAGAVIYNQQVEATFQFYYLEMKFKLSNYFTDLINQLGNQVKLRLSVYDPRYIMPSLNTLNLLMNIPPQNCYLEVMKPLEFVEFLDEIHLQVLGCEDQYTRLLYSVQLFQNYTIYQQDLQEDNFYHYILISPYQESNEFILKLPFLSKKDSILLINICDQNQGITNLTYSLEIKEYLNLTESTFDSYLLNLESLDQKLIGYNVITQRLQSINNYTSYQQAIFTNLTLLDTKQPLLSNLTESLYRSISNLLILNLSFLLDIEEQFQDSLKYRILDAQNQLNILFNLQKNNQLTSAQNIDKLNYIKQYHTFIDILSSCIGYKVLQNKTSTFYQEQLQYIQDSFQNISVANEPIKSITSNSVNQDLGFLTTKIAQEITSAKTEQLSRILEEADQSISNTSTDFYKYSMTRFIDNPFYADTKFPKNSSGYQAVDPKLQVLNTTSNINASGMKFKFPTTKKLQPNTSTSCITKLNGDWDANVCKTIKEKNGETNCVCDSLNPTSIMEQLDFIADKASEAFSLDTLLAFGRFPFYKTYVFYFYLMITGVYLYSIYWGIKADNEMFSKIAAEEALKEEQEQNNKKNENIQEDVEQEDQEQSEERDQRQDGEDGEDARLQVKEEDLVKGEEQKDKKDREQNLVKIEDIEEQQPNSLQRQQSIKPLYSFEAISKDLDKKNQNSPMENCEIISLKQLDGFKQLDAFKKNPHLSSTQYNFTSNAQSIEKVIINQPLNNCNSPVENLSDKNQNEEDVVKVNCGSNNCIFSQLNQQNQLTRTEIQQENKAQDENSFEKFERMQKMDKNSKSSSDSKQHGLKDLIIKSSISKLKAYVEYLKFFHQILQIIYKSDEKKPRGLRASIIYLSILGSLAVLFIFNQPNNLSFTVTLAIITTPINKIYQLILEKLLSHKNKRIRQIGAVFMIICAGLISYVMLAGLVMLDSIETANQWSYIFIGTFSIDNFLYCPLQLCVQYVIHMEFIKLPIFQKILDKLLDKKAKEFLYGLIDFGDTE